LGSSDFRAEIGFLVLAVNALLLIALRCVAWDDNVTNFNSGDSFSNTFNNTGCLVSKNAWELSFRIASVESVDIGMTEGIGDDFDSDLTFFGRIDKDFLNDEGFLGFVSNGSFTENGFALKGFHKKRYEK
jgi:hypothetical protein